MTYRVYIKKDYKPEVSWAEEHKTLSLLPWAALFSLMLVTGGFYLLKNQGETKGFVPAAKISQAISPDSVTLPAETTAYDSATKDLASHIVEAAYQPDAPNEISTNEINAQVDIILDSTTTLEPLDITPPTEETNTNWQTVTVKRGDSMALIFSRLGLSPYELYQVMALGQDVARLKKIQPGQILHFHIVDGKLLGLEYEFDLTNMLSISLKDDTYKAELVKHELESVVKNASAVINDSLFLAGKQAGLSDNLIMQMVAIYGWDIDFALDIRRGDSFTLIYEEKYKDGVKVADGPILAAEFNNRGQTLRAMRYAHADGSIDYYDDEGDAMRKAFLRTPVNFTRISSRFSLGRKHPILNKIRAHKGVDYAAPTGTPIKATGDGTVVYAGNKGGYGRMIVLKHGGTYSTVYAHLHKYANGIRTGKRVKQGQIIGYVGMSGLATGPHLHYEFRINGVHRNPLTVALPDVESIGKDEILAFKKSITPMLAELDRLTGKTLLATEEPLLTENTVTPVLKDGS